MVGNLLVENVENYHHKIVVEKSDFGDSVEEAAVVTVEMGQYCSHYEHNHRDSKNGNLMIDSDNSGKAEAVEAEQIAVAVGERIVHIGYCFPQTVALSALVDCTDNCNCFVIADHRQIVESPFPCFVAVVANYAFLAAVVG